MANRREILIAGALAPLVVSLPGRAADLRTGLDDSELVYISPLRSDGNLSACQAEVWFQHHEGAVYVVTASGAWRAQAVGKGLTRAKMWVGDVGQWRSSNGTYRDLPSTMVTASMATATEVHEAVLDKMGSKYTLEWFVWGPRFRKGLADGSRVMIRYEMG